MNTLKIIVGILLLISCSNKEEITKPNDINYKQEMRNFVIGISQYSKSIQGNFYIIPQNGIELVTTNGEDNGEPNVEYLNSIDGNGQEDLFYGYLNDNQSTPSVDNLYLRSFLDISKNSNKKILAIDYCSTPTKMDDAYKQNNDIGYVSFSADSRELNNIPNYPTPIFSENNINISSLSEVQNFLYLINLENFTDKTELITAVTSTNYDLLIMDLFFNGGISFTKTDINQLKNKKNSGRRLVICYMSIGEAENYRYYWKPEWNLTKPSWVDEENQDWKGNYKVKYWDLEWQSIIYGNDTSYLKLILDANFDGVYLDIIDAFEYYENQDFAEVNY